MTLIGILLALLIERGLSHVREWREHAWYKRYVNWLADSVKAEWLWQTPFGLALLLGAPLLVAGLIQGALDGGFLEVLGLIWAVLVLILCLGPRDLGEEVHAFIEASHRDDTEAMTQIADDLGVNSQNGKDDSCRPLSTAVFIQGHERLLAVLFWFFVLGPLGALLYRLTASLAALLPAMENSSDDLREATVRLHAVLAWVPARITAGLYMLAGSTNDAIAGWSRAHQNDNGDWAELNWRILALVGCGAMQLEDAENKKVEMNAEDSLLEALGLVRRALFLALGILAAFTLGGWIV
ncbi:MAG: regulatory signaling modulator protein AmpE [Salinisphaeraceae bacterium]|nr:regulatory signaling modulator protein AmpE [Salinisphaeraceae bacterium]